MSSDSTYESSSSSKKQDSTEYRDLGSLHHYRTEIPNIIYELGLTAYEIALYTVIKRTAGDSGNCFKSTRKIARESGMSIGMVSKTKLALSKPRKQLGGKALIRIIKRKTSDGDDDTDLIEVNDITSFMSSCGGIQ